MAKTKPFASLHLSILHIFHMVLTASSRISLTNQNVFRAPSLRWRKGFPARSRKFPAPPNRENFGSTLKALRNLWVYFRKLPEKISNTRYYGATATSDLAGAAHVGWRYGGKFKTFLY